MFVIDPSSINQFRAQIRTWRGKHVEQSRRWVRRFTARTFARISPEQLRAALEDLAVGPSRVLLVHSSLSACGYFTGGPDSVVDALTDVCSTLCMPAHTYCYPEGPESIAPLFSADRTPSKSGILTEAFSRRPGVTRSIHSTHSMAACGPLAEDLCRDHYKCDTPCGVGTPYAALVSLRASVLLFGVDFHSYTLFHTAEDASGSRWAYEECTLDQLRVIDERGGRQARASRRQSRTPRRFRETGTLLESAGLTSRITLGRGTLTFVPDCSKVHDFLVERLKQTPDFLYQSCARSLQ